jgi:hypothetical protein
MLGLTARLLRFDCGMTLAALDLCASIGLACFFSRLAGQGHLARPYQKGACVRLVFFQRPTQNCACSCMGRNNNHILGRGLVGLRCLPSSPSVSYCMISHPACIGRSSGDCHIACRWEFGWRAAEGSRWIAEKGRRTFTECRSLLVSSNSYTLDSASRASYL